MRGCWSSECLQELVENMMRPRIPACNNMVCAHALQVAHNLSLAPDMTSIGNVSSPCASEKAEPAFKDKSQTFKMP